MTTEVACKHLHWRIESDICRCDDTAHYHAYCLDCRKTRVYPVTWNEPTYGQPQGRYGHYARGGLS